MTKGRLAAVLGGLSLATDMAAGNPSGTAMTAAVLAVRIGRQMGLPDEQLGEIYYAGIVRFIGCTSTSDDTADMALGDELTAYLALSRADPADSNSVRSELESIFANDKPADEARAVIDAVVGMGANVYYGGLPHCEQAVSLCQRIPVPDAVPSILSRLESRWDDQHPVHPAGPDLPLATRIIEYCVVAELHRRAGGLRSMVEVSQARSGGQFDPSVVGVVLDNLSDITSTLTSSVEWQSFLDSEPGIPVTVDRTGIRQVAEAFGDFTDNKSHYFVGHSRQVASLATRAAREMSDESGWRTSVEHAGLLHDLGKCAISNGIWNKPPPLSAYERTQSQTHPFHTERILGLSDVFDHLRDIACSAHERRDGSGFHRRTRLNDPGAALLATANLFHELTSDAPGRDGLKAEDAAEEVMAEVAAGKLPQREAVLVLDCAGQQASAKRSYPDGITDREAEVLFHLARGVTNNVIADRLGISPKTVDNHLQNLYIKIGAESRTAAALYAFERGIYDR